MDVEKRGRGRPKTDKPKRHQINMKFDDDEFKLIQTLQYDMGMVKSDVLRTALLRLYDDIKRYK